MSQWNQGQPGFQYPMQTGFPGGNPQFQQNSQFQPQNTPFQQPGQFGYGIPSSGGMVPQQTGFPVQRAQGMMQAQQTGFPGAPSLLQPQATGFPGGNFQQGRPAPPPVPPIPPQFQGNQPSFLNAPPPQPNRLLSVSPGFGSGLVPQQTGFPGQGGGMVMPQMTGFVDPRLQMMSQTFMPMNTSSPSTASGLPQLQPQPQNLIQSFQQHNQTQRGTTTQQISWAPTKAEKKSYDNIFRQWVQGAPFMSGTTALEVFGASGLSRDDLARVWTLADVEDRGKLNLAEFHIAMALIYRKLNGMELPEQLPQELVPPSRRDLDDSVDRVKDLLEKESRNHSPSSTDSPVSYLKNRSFNSSSPSFATSRDATIYKHSDLDQGSVYKPRSRHIDRDAIRSRDDEDNPSADLQDMKRRLGNTARMLDRAAEAEAQRTKEDEELAQEMADLNYRVKRVQEDLEYNSRGPPNTSKENERRRLERELLSLMHERIPEVERKIKDREERKERERRQWARDRDRANEKFGRYDSRDDYSRRDDRDRPYSRGEDRDRSYSDRDRPYSRGEDRPRSRIDYDHDRDDRERKERNYERPRSPQSKAAPPVPPPAPAPAPPKSIPSPAPSPQVSTPSLSSMTPEQKRAYLSEQAKLRVQARMVALGVTTPTSTSPSLDTSVEERLQQEKKEAEEKAKAAEKQAEERERVRRERLENEKAMKEGRVTPGPPPTPTPTLTAPPPAPAPKAPTPVAPPTLKAKVPPAPPKPRARPIAPPPPKAVVTSPVAVRAAAPTPPKPAPEPEVESDDEELRAREVALRKAREERERARQARQKKLKDLEDQEAAAAHLEEEQYRQRMEALKAKAAKPATPPVVSVPRIQTTPPVAPPAAITIPTPPPQAPSSAPVVSATEKSTNPFSRLLKGGSSSASTTPAETNGAANPWAMPQTAPPARSPSRSPAPSSAKTSYQTAPSSAIDDDWEDARENEDEDDSSDDDMSLSRNDRADIAQKLFGGMVPRPSSTPLSPPDVSVPVASSAYVPPAPAPPPPPAPPAPPPVTPAAAAAPTGNRGALFAAIQGGKALRPTMTVDKSGPPVTGKVLSDAAPPSNIHTTPQSPPIPILHVSTSDPPVVSPNISSKSDNRQSVDWVAVRAADVGGSPVIVERLPSTLEAEEEEYIPEVLPTEPTSDLMADVDRSIEHRVRSLYAFEGEGQEDLSFAENQMIVANPSKSGGDWWFGKLVTTGKSGLFPRAYVEVVQPRKAKAIYSYAGANSDELTFDEGETLDLVDTSEEEWWKAEQNGAVLVVPAAYLELVEG